MSLDLLVIAAHPDDAEMAVGGTLLVAKQRDQSTGVLDLTRGELSSRGDLETRARETAAASELLGLDYRGNLDLPDGGLRDTHEARAALVDRLRELHPRVVLAPWRDDLHPDHSAAGELLWRSLYQGGILKFAPGRSPHRPVSIGFYMCHSTFEPSVIVDVSEVHDRKLEAVRAYGSQFEPGDGPKTKISSPYFVQGLEGRARHYGMAISAMFGEPLRFNQALPVKDLVSVMGGGA